MKLRIVSDGTPMRTRLETEDGQLIEGVTGIRWSINCLGRAEAVIDLEAVPLDVSVHGAETKGIVDVSYAKAKFDSVEIVGLSKKDENAL